MNEDQSGWIDVTAIRQRQRRNGAYDPAKSRARTNKSNRGVDESALPPPIKAGHCDLCEKPTAQLHWDHDHDLEELGFPLVECHRGWLCFNCNGGLGKLDDTPQGLARALAYSQLKLPGQRDC